MAGRDGADVGGDEALARLCASGDYDVVVAALDQKFTAEVLADAKVKGIANYAVGTDNVDLDACARHGVAVGRTPDVLTDATADLAWALILAAVSYGAFRLAKRYRRLYLAFLAGFVPFVIVLYFFYENVNRLLPAAI